MEEQRSLQQADYIGEWHVLFTDFPMWLGGRRRKPRFIYEAGIRGGRQGLLDTVRYEQGGRTREIKGFDYVLDAQYTRFCWRGNGIMSLLRSNWRLIYISEDKSWAIIRFRKTLFTPDGVDLISRNPLPDAQLLETMRQALKDCLGNRRLSFIG